MPLSYFCKEIYVKYFIIVSVTDRRTKRSASDKKVFCFLHTAGTNFNKNPHFEPRIIYYFLFRQDSSIIFRAGNRAATDI